MNVDDREARLNDYLDGLLDDEEARDVEAEMARDPEYRALEQSLRRVVTDAAALPKGVAPARDLWREIEARLGQPGAIGERGLAPGLKYALLAASFAAVFLAGIYFAQLQRTGPPDRITQLDNSTDSASPSGLDIVETEYGQARNLLVQALDESRDRLAPETVAVVDENLDIIGNAITEIKSALEQDPSNQRLIRSLVVAYDHEVELLQQATQLPAQL
jgi:hypothetical protein